MAKKVLSIVLAAIMLMSVVVVGSFAADDDDTYEMLVKKLILGDYIVNDITDDLYAEMLAADPGILDENIAFWDDEIIDAYYDAETENDWEELYNEMMGSWVMSYEELTDYYPQHLLNGKAKTDVYYTADKEYIPVGAAETDRTINVQVAVSTNFYCLDCEVAIIYDKTLMDYVPGSAKIVEKEGRKQFAAIGDFGILENGTNMKSDFWPASMRKNANGEFDKYGIVKVSTTIDENTSICCVKFDKTPIATAQFVAKEGLTEGTKLEFYAVDGVQPKIEDFEHLEGSGFVTAFKTGRGLSAVRTETPSDVFQFDQTYTFYPAIVTVGEPAPDLADYTALDAALDAFDDTNAADYKTALWNAYAEAVAAGEAVERDLPAAQQDTVDAAAAAINTAYAALDKNEVISAVQKLTAVIGANAKVEITVDGNPDQVRLAAGSDDTFTFIRDDAFSIVANDDGTETWTVEVPTSSTSKEYTATAKYANWTENGKNVTVFATDGQDLNIYAIYVEDMKYAEIEGENVRNNGILTMGKHKVVVRTGKDVYKIQFVDTTGKIEDGCTNTFCSDPNLGAEGYKPTVTEDGDQLVWTFEFPFVPYGEWSMPVRTRSTSTTFSTTNAELMAYVIY